MNALLTRRVGALALAALALTLAAPPATSLPFTSPGAYSEDFEGGAVGWVLTGLWHVSSCRAASGLSSLAYNTLACPPNFDLGVAHAGTAQSPPVNLPLEAPIALTWKSWHDTESGTTYDRKRVEVSPDGGVTWTHVWTESGTQRVWNLRSVDLSLYAGLQILVRFSFDTVDAVANKGEGWYVDDVTVTGNGPVPDLVDVDGDRIPDVVEAQVCGRAITRDFINGISPTAGRCVSPSDYAAPAVAVTFSYPYDHTLGPDRDNDEFPDHATTRWKTMTVSPFSSGGVLSTAPAADVVHDVDPDDLNPNVPVRSIVPISEPVPYGVRQGPDADRDIFPAHLELLRHQATFDRRAYPFFTYAAAPSLVQGVDPDDNNPNSPVPYSLVDADGDRIPDASEPSLCRVQDANTNADGWCGTPDGSNPNDYTPPVRLF